MLEICLFHQSRMLVDTRLGPNQMPALGKYALGLEGEREEVVKDSL